jgi:hypothetical protein
LNYDVDRVILCIIDNQRRYCSTATSEEMKEMNEKLKQLYLCTFAPSISDSAVCEEGAKKFAELIVRECAQMADFADKNPGDYVLKHFGVEE